MIPTPGPPPPTLALAAGKEGSATFTLTDYGLFGAPTLTTYTETLHQCRDQWLPMNRCWSCFYSAL